MKKIIILLLCVLIVPFLTACSVKKAVVVDYVIVKTNGNYYQTYYNVENYDIKNGIITLYFENGNGIITSSENVIIYFK